MPSTTKSELIKKNNTDKFFSTDDTQQIVKPPQDDSTAFRGDDDDEDKHRGFSSAEDALTDPETAPRNKYNGSPGFDAAEKLRKSNRK